VLGLPAPVAPIRSEPLAAPQPAPASMRK